LTIIWATKVIKTVKVKKKKIIDKNQRKIFNTCKEAIMEESRASRAAAHSLDQHEL
jgi:hypothetical protein